MGNNYSYKHKIKEWAPYYVFGLILSSAVVIRATIGIEPPTALGTLMYAIGQLAYFIILLAVLYLIIYMFITRILVYDDHIEINKVFNKTRVDYCDVFDVQAKINYYGQVMLIKIKMNDGRSVLFLYSKNDGHDEIVDAIENNISDASKNEYIYPPLTREKLYSLIPTVAGLGLIYILLLGQQHVDGNIKLLYYLLITYFSYLTCRYLIWNHAILTYSTGKITITIDGINYIRNNKMTSILWSEKPEVSVQKLGYKRPMKVTIKSGDKSITYIRFIRFSDSLHEQVMTYAGGVPG